MNALWAGYLLGLLVCAAVILVVVGFRAQEKR